MANPVYIDFIVRGIPNVQRALKTVQDAALAAERANTSRARSESTQRQRIADQEAKAKIRAMMKADRWQKQAQDKAIRETEKAARDEVRIAERKAKDVQRIKDREFRDLERWAARSEALQKRADFVRERDEMRNRRRFASHIGGAAVGGLTSSAGRITRMSLATAGLVGQLGGGFSIADSVQRNIKNSGAVADLLNAGVNANSAIAGNRKKRSAGEVNAVLDVASTQFGQERSQGIEGLRAFAGTTGDIETGMKLLPRLAELSVATGTKLEDMAAAAGKAGLNFDTMTDSSAKAEKIMEVMRTAAGQGKAGTVEIKDMAVQMGKLVATSNKFTGNNVENLAKMGMLAQFAAGGGGAWSASSAATSVTAFGATFGKAARVDAFKAAGVDVFSDKGHTKLRAPEQIIADAFEKTKGDQVAVSKLFGSAMSMRAINKFGDAFQNGYTNQEGKKLTGREAILGMAKDLTSNASMSKGDVSDAAASKMQEADAQMARIREEFDKAVREKIIPTLLKLVPQFEKLAQMLPDIVGKALPAFVDLIKTVGDFVSRNREWVDWMASNPIPVIVGAELAKALGPAVLGEAMKIGISKAFGDAGMGLKGVFGNLAAAAGIASAALIAIQAGKSAIDAEYKGYDANTNRSNVDQGDAATLTARLRNGTASAAERQEAAQMVGKLRGDRDQMEKDQQGGFFKKVGRGLAGLTDEGKQAQADEEKNNAQALSNLTTSIKQLETALRDNTGATKGNTTGANSGPGGAARNQSIVQRNGVK